MANTAKKATLDDAWEIIRELGEAQKETDRQLKETDRQLKETDRQLKETDRRFNTQWGRLVESLVEGDIVNKFSDWGIQVEGTTQRAKKTFENKQYEFDIIVHNGEEIIAVEVKTVLDVKKVDHFIEKLKMLKKVFPEYTDKRLYGAVAYLRADSESDEYSKSKKLFVIKATGNSSSITNPKEFKPMIF